MVIVRIFSKMKDDVIKALKTGRLQNINEIHFAKVPLLMNMDRKEERSIEKTNSKSTFKHTFFYLSEHTFLDFQINQLG